MPNDNFFTRAKSGLTQANLAAQQPQTIASPDASSRMQAELKQVRDERDELSEKLADLTKQSNEANAKAIAAETRDAQTLAQLAKAQNEVKNLKDFVRGLNEDLHARAAWCQELVDSFEESTDEPSGKAAAVNSTTQQELRAT